MAVFDADDGDIQLTGPDTEVSLGGRRGEGRGGLIGNCIKMEFTSASVCGLVHIRTYVRTERL